MNAAAGYEVGAAVGTVRTHSDATVAGAVCLLTPRSSFASRGAARPGVALRASVGSRLVARNAFLDGTVRRSHSVARERIVNTATVSAALNLKAVSLEYELVTRTREYRTEPSPFTYGTVRLAYRW